MEFFFNLIYEETEESCTCFVPIYVSHFKFYVSYLMYHIGPFICH